MSNTSETILLTKESYIYLYKISAHDRLSNLQSCTSEKINEFAEAGWKSKTKEYYNNNECCRADDKTFIGASLIKDASPHTQLSRWSVKDIKQRLISEGLTYYEDGKQIRYIPLSF